MSDGNDVGFPPDNLDDGVHSFEGDECADYQYSFKGIASKDFDVSSTIEVLERLQVGWHGTSSCCHASRISVETKKAFDRWVATQTAAHPGLAVLEKSHTPIRGKCSRWRDGPWGGRECQAIGSMDCVIKFYAP